MKGNAWTVLSLHLAKDFAKQNVTALFECSIDYIDLFSSFQTTFLQIYNISRISFLGDLTHHFEKSYTPLTSYFH